MASSRATERKRQGTSFYTQAITRSTPPLCLHLSPRPALPSSLYLLSRPSSPQFTDVHPSSIALKDMLLEAGTLGACSFFSLFLLPPFLSFDFHFFWPSTFKERLVRRPPNKRPPYSVTGNRRAGTVGCAGYGCTAGVRCSAAKTLPPVLFFLSLPYSTSVCAVLTRPKDNDIDLPQDTRCKLHRCARLGGVARAVVEVGVGSGAGKHGIVGEEVMLGGASTRKAQSLRTLLALVSTPGAEIYGAIELLHWNTERRELVPPSPSFLLLPGFPSPPRVEHAGLFLSFSSSSSSP
ncbi:hypothetical protein B0H13DRAFT_2362163 [Mycena leptocephala]|nr:hypothetical protein B0H13DRAFT_2362163 [Mycena leptocephala]